MRFISALCSGLLAAAAVQAQQYAGTPIKLSTPNTAGAEKAFFLVKDAEGGNTTLVNYYSLPTSTGERPDPAKLQRLVIPLTGTQRDAWNYFSHARTALLAAMEINPEVNDQTVALLSPWWANDADFRRGSGDTLVWRGTGWYRGDDNIFPAAQKTVSSFDALDQILQHYSDKSIYPNINQIVIVGHSRGAQMSQRYAVMGKNLNLSVPVVYYMGNPSSFAWLNSSRPVSTSGCPTFNMWSEGLANYTNSYNYDDAQDEDLLRSRYASRDIAYARGLADFGKSDDDCKPKSQGANRGERMFNFLTSFPPDSGDTVDYNEKITHNDLAMFSATSGLYRLFLDNFDGSGSRQPDFGPRQIPGDNPHPDA